MADDIKIKPSRKGSLHDALGIGRNKLISDSRIQSALNNDPSPALKKKLVFAENAKKWNS